jgi:hypothetical protein
MYFALDVVGIAFGLTAMVFNKWYIDRILEVQALLWGRRFRVKDRLGRGLAVVAGGAMVLLCSLDLLGFRLA